MGLGPTEILIIAGILILLFGAKKLPDLARGSGRALRIFKSETKGLMKDEDDDERHDPHGRPLPPGTGHSESHQQQSPQPTQQPYEEPRQQPYEEPTQQPYQQPAAPESGPRDSQR